MQSPEHQRLAAAMKPAALSPAAYYPPSAGYPAPPGGVPAGPPGASHDFMVSRFRPQGSLDQPVQLWLVIVIALAALTAGGLFGYMLKKKK